MKVMKTSAGQFELLVSFMEQNGDLSRAPSDPTSKIRYLRNWKRLTHLLNKMECGDTKSTEKWRKVWSDYKNNTKKKAVRIHRASTDIGSGPVHARLNNLEERVLNMIGVKIESLTTKETIKETTKEPSLFPSMKTRDAHTLNLDTSLTQRNTAVVITRVASPPPVILLLDTETDIKDHSQLKYEPDSSDHQHVRALSDHQHVRAPSYHTHIRSPSPDSEVVLDEVEDQNTNIINLTEEFPPKKCSRSPPQPDPSAQTEDSSELLVEMQPTLSGHTSQRKFRGSYRRHRNSKIETAMQYFFKCDREKRKFEKQRLKEEMELRREENRIRSDEVQARREWAHVASRAIGLLEKIVNKYINK